jgi:multidrug efflux pump subunit AcrA (membrane-fusion protein)
VFVVDAGSRAALRWITLGPAVGDSVEVLSGLRADEQYVVDPDGQMHDGAALAVAR